MGSFGGDIPFCMEQAICALRFFFSSKSITSSCAQPPPRSKEANLTQIWASYVKDIGS